MLPPFFPLFGVFRAFVDFFSSCLLSFLSHCPLLHLFKNVTFYRSAVKKWFPPDWSKFFASHTPSFFRPRCVPLPFFFLSWLKTSFFTMLPFFFVFAVFPSPNRFQVLFFSCFHFRTRLFFYFRLPTFGVPPLPVTELFFSDLFCR